jgi:acyl-coenzyme A thioesterase PaaI-like protein
MVLASDGARESAAVKLPSHMLFPAGIEVLTAEFKINLLAPAKGLDLVATAEVIGKGRRLSVCLARIEVDPEAARGVAFPV